MHGNIFKLWIILFVFVQATLPWPGSHEILRFPRWVEEERSHQYWFQISQIMEAPAFRWICFTPHLFFFEFQFDLISLTFT